MGKEIDQSIGWFNSRSQLLLKVGRLKAISYQIESYKRNISFFYKQQYIANLFRVKHLSFLLMSMTYVNHILFIPVSFYDNEPIIDTDLI